jgi:imidazolonepropionase
MVSRQVQTRADPVRTSAIWINADVAAMTASGPPYGLVKDGAVVVADGRIAWVGTRGDLEADSSAAIHDAGGGLITPGLIDCHTHLVFAANRADEFEQRLHGATYEEIARAGGGIRSTVAATRAASEAELYAQSLRRLNALVSGGVTTVEIKSGYGLDVDSELKMLRVARKLGAETRVTVRTTFLGAHALPAEYEGRRADYIDLVAGPMLDRVAGEGLADAVDAFAENIAFTNEEVARVFDTAKRLGLPIKLHADQLSDQGGAALAARYRALSADHLEHAGEAGVIAMARSGTVATLLPGAFYFLRERKAPPIELFRRHGVPIAIATDCNPGSSPALSLPLIIGMAATLFRVTPEEALAGVTRNAARALGFTDRGILEPGKVADMAIWDVRHPAELAYWIGGAPLRAVVKGGETLGKHLSK